MICWWCGSRLTNPFGRPVEGEDVVVDGVARRCHKVCAPDAREFFARHTAKPPEDQDKKDIDT